MACGEDFLTANATSPASSGPAGSHFEGQVGAHYLLSLLVGTEPRGLPGTTIDSVKFQRAAEGHPLDDVIVHAHDPRGNLAVLEIQVKRSIAFTPSDPVFRTVVRQIAQAANLPGFQTGRYELAIATARTSHKIDGAYQDVLTWARQLLSASTFFDRIQRPGSANDDMRRFVQTFRSHLHDAGVVNDDETVWQLLRRLRILVFDFTSQASASEELAKERAVRALHPDDRPRAETLWNTLTELALEIGANAGERNRESLIEELTRRSFRLAGHRRYFSARATIAEASRDALSDIGDRVGNVTLTRLEPVAAIHAALDGARYIEIRGDAGVGKSAVLRHFAEQTALEGRVIVFSPGRTIPRGWIALRAVLGFDGSARDLLVDLAIDGGALLFIDNLDLFGNEERTTVVDLVREAANVSGLAVIATARRNFGIEEPSWLPADALDRLGRAEPIIIGELTDVEVDELRHIAPALAPLLADHHPARDVTRNLYRLARLASQQQDEPIPHTEIDMAERWWQTADGKIDANHRDRSRLLKALAEQALLLRAEAFDVSDCPAAAVDGLVASETLRDFGNDRITFRHDVLREWAIANLLHSDPDAIQRLPLNRPAPAVLARSVELAARIKLERTSDGASWSALLDLLSREGIHGSWRRSVVLALVRSEIGTDLLARASPLLLDDRAKLLRGLIRTVMAVDVQPASQLFARAGFDPAIIPASMNVPSGPSWHRLIVWLLSLGENLPPAAIPDVVGLYTTWSAGMLGVHPFTPILLQWLYRWLREIEAARASGAFRPHRQLFAGVLDHEQTDSLESDLRIGFLMFCNRTPTLAADYLRSLLQHRNRNRSANSILKFRGTLAQAAPAELAELTAAILIPEKTHEEEDPYQSRFEIREPFNFTDRDFIPASPAQGPFLELLIHAPEHGLSQVHRLVDHAISFYTDGRSANGDAIIIPYKDGDRPFPWVRSYTWSRDGALHQCVTSTLMALEAWGHRRIQAGEPFDKVLADILGPPDAPAAYLLLAVDLLLSHWPISREAAVPFLGCPELLCLDRERHLHDNYQFPDILGLGALQKEPVGAVSLATLKKYPSRRHMLDHLIGQYGAFGPPELRESLRDLLRRATARLGPPNDQTTLGDPARMAVYALNLLDPSNWPEVTITRNDGTQITARKYEPPGAERQHFERLQENGRERQTAASMQASIGLALEDPSRSSPAFAAQAIAWAQDVAPSLPDDDTDAEWMRKEAIYSAAMIAMRDGDAELRSRQAVWARGIFTQALQTKEDPAHRFRSGLRFNPIAIAVVGMIHSLRDTLTPDRVRALLEVAARGNPAAAHGFSAAAFTLAEIDGRLPRSVLRCCFTAAIRPTRHWRVPEEETEAREDRLRQRVQDAIEAEVAWLADERSEPDWPEFRPVSTSPRRRRIILEPEQPASAPPRHAPPEEYTDHQAAALWLRNIAPLADVIKRPWLRGLVRAYVQWTAAANGAGLTQNEEIDHPPTEWNDAYYDLLAKCLPGLEAPDIDAIALTPITSLPNEPFFDVTTRFLRSIDVVFFNNNGLKTEEAVRIRSALAHRLMATNGWQRLAGSRSNSVAVHIGPAIAVFFFNDHGRFQPTKCYLSPKAIDQLDPFLPVLQTLVQAGPSFLTALITLNLLEVSPKPSHLPFIIMAAVTWLRSYPECVPLWIDNDTGRRICVLIDDIWRKEPALLDGTQTLRSDVDQLLAALVRMGVADAARLERALIAHPDS